MHHTDFVTTLFEGKDHPKKVTVALSISINALKKGHSATLILMTDAVALAQKGSLDGLDIGPPFEPAGALLDQFAALGGQLAVCAACLSHARLPESETDPRWRIITGADVVDLLMAAKGRL